MTELQNLWAKRQHLSEDEIDRLYRLVHQYLLRSQYGSLLSDIGLSLEEGIHDFFYAKVYQGNSESPLDSETVLFTYFKRYLLDALPAAQRIVGEDRTGPSPQSSLCADEAVFRREADLFLNQEEAWVSVYLGYTSCVEDGNKVRASTLFKRHVKLRAYAYQCKKLGVLSSKRRIPWHNYHETRIGQWLLSLGLEITPEYTEEILCAFKILCEQALSRVNPVGLN